MKTLLKAPLVIMGLIAAVTTAGVYSAAASNGAAEPQPKTLQVDAGPASEDAHADKVVRVVGPRFFPDNGNIKLHGAADRQTSKQ